MYRVKSLVICFILFCIYSALVTRIMLHFLKSVKENLSTVNDLRNKKENEEVAEANRNQTISIEIWGKASISLYMWKHILKGPVSSFNNGFINLGSLQFNNLELNFRNGPGIAPSTVPKNTQYLVIVLNGRSIKKVNEAKKWLNFTSVLSNLKRLIIVLLGNEECDNNWILPYMKSRGGNADAVFLVYDSPLIDNLEFFQWPLGVADYRGFPVFSEHNIDSLNKRPYIANFVGTVYKGSSRESLVSLITTNKLTDKVHLIYRNKWMPDETQETRNQFIEALQLSDLTLSPVGMNSECYRIYEALSLGSVPVVEDVVTPGRCDRAPPAPLRLLKRLEAPIIWITNWTYLPDILRQEQMLTFQAIVKRRKNIVTWYEEFKNKMKVEFIKVIEQKFLNPN